MVNCCAVNCTNHSNKKESKGKVSFHDLPVAEGLRAKWLRNICRANWVPKETDKLCSSHFLPSNYRTGVKHRILLPDAVPTVFEGYPSYLIHKPHLRKPPAERQPLPLNPRQQQVLADSEVTTSQLQHDSTHSEDTNAIALVTKIAVENSNVATANVPTKCEPTALQAQRRELRKDNKLALLRKQVKAQRQQISRMRSKIKGCDQEITCLKQTVEKARAFRYTDIVEKILQAAESKDLTAMLLKNQMDSFVRKRVAWNKALLRQCMLWHNCSPRGYNYARKNRLLKLPNKSSLWRFLGTTHGKVMPAALPQEMLMPQDQTASSTLLQELLLPVTLDMPMILSQDLALPQAKELGDQVLQVWTTLCNSSTEGLDNPENGILGFVNSIEVE